MTLMPEVQQALARAVTRPTRARKPRRWRSRRTILFALLAVLISGSALAATQWVPQLGNGRGKSPSRASSEIPTDQLADLAVLRRPQSASDRGPQVQAVLKLLSAHEIGGVHTDGIRLLSRHEGGAMVLIPSQRTGADEKGVPLHATVNALNVLYSYQLTPRTATVRRRDGSTRQITTPAGRASTAVSGTIAQLHTGEIAGIATDQNSVHLYGLVPDSVARVQATLRGHKTRTAEVHNNAYDLPLGSQAGTLTTLRQQNGHPNIRWLDQHGREVPRR